MFVTFNANNNLFGSVTNVGTKDTTPETKLGGIARSPFDRDSVSISPQARKNNALQQLTERKEDIRQEKMEYQIEALANGEDPEIMEAKLEMFDARIEEIDNQINDLFKPELETKQTQENRTSKQPQSKEEAEAIQMVHLTTAGTNLDNAQKIQSTLNKVEGEISVKESQAELDTKNAEFSYDSKMQTYDKLAQTGLSENVIDTMRQSATDSLKNAKESIHNKMESVGDLKMKTKNIDLFANAEMKKANSMIQQTEQEAETTQLSLYDMEATKLAYQLTQSNITA